MEDLYSIHPAIPRSSAQDQLVHSSSSCQHQTIHFHHHQQQEIINNNNDDDDLLHQCPQEDDDFDLDLDLPTAVSDLIKAQIVAHPRYPSLLSAYIECRKVGAPPETASLLEEIRMENFTPPCSSSSCSREIGVDPELDEFMESYCQILMKYKEELSKPFDEATSFLTKIEMQLSDLCKTTSTSGVTTAAATTCNSISDEAGGSSEELSVGEMEASESQEGCSKLGDQEMKEMLLKKYSGYLSNLRKEFLKKRKKGKLPKDARLTLLDWWNTHYRWPYPTEEEKMKLAETTGLDQKQINNWFINQRKRHWNLQRTCPLPSWRV